MNFDCNPGYRAAERLKTKSSGIGKIIRGYLGEFLIQSEQQLPACNIEHDRSPATKAYWDSKPEDFREAIAGGVYHTAAAYNRLRAFKNDEFGLSAIWHALTFVIRHTIDTFTEEYPTYNPIKTPVATIYNNHDYVVWRRRIIADPESWLLHFIGER